ncbi:MAG: 5-(carboxyamino)imidazole ribonucleotide mutase [Oscillospiraceae bacterium]|jgi:5-(carboxyamino)imidazole ribonucleotide mutase|nr:5-(carboxyamino)imidazole ribonucleotide mutase [Oscillospiraceae bacterium]
MKKVAVIMGSDSDLPVAEKAADVLKGFGVPVTVRVMSAHRSPGEVARFVSGAKDAGYGAIIAAAGMAAHLAGACAANTILPVIAVPVKSNALDGIDALLSSVMMPPGVPVATVAIDGAANAGYLAAQILALEDGALAEKLAAFKEAQREKNAKADKKVRERYEQQ